jgi:hypothetical protein
MGQEGANWFIWLRIESTAIRTCEHGNEPSDSVKGDLFLDWLSDY